MNQHFNTWVLLAIVAAIGVFAAASVLQELPGLSFGLTVSRDFRSTTNARRVMHSFWIEIAVVTAIALAGVGLAAGRRSPWASAVPVAQTAIVLFTFARARRRVRPFVSQPHRPREAQLSPGPIPWPGSAGVHVGPIAILLAGATYVAAINQTRNLASYAGLGLGVAVVLFVRLVRAWTTKGASRLRNGADEVDESVRKRRLTDISLIAAQYFAAILATGVTIGSGHRFSHLGIAVLVLVAAYFVVLVIISTRDLGGPGRRSVASISDGTNDDHWIGGFLYFNPQDPSLWVQRRLGLGHTVNLGRVTGWLVLLGFAALGATVIWLIK